MSNVKFFLGLSFFPLATRSCPLISFLVHFPLSLYGCTCACVCSYNTLLPRIPVCVFVCVMVLDVHQCVIFLLAAF